MVNYSIKILKQAVKDKDKIKQYPALESNVRELVKLLADNPFQTPPRYEVLQGNLKGLYSRRINRQHRLVYKILEEEKIVYILSMWTHYE